MEESPTPGLHDPRLRRSFPVAPPEAVAKATIDGVDVYVTANEVPDEDRPEEPGLRIWHAVTGELLRTTLDAAGDQLATTEIAGRAVAVVAGMENSPQVVDLATGAVEPLPDHGGGVRALTIADVVGAPHVVTASAAGLLHLTDLTSGSTRSIDCGEPLRAVAAVPSGTGATVVVAGETVLHLIDPVTGQRMPAPAVSGPVRSIAGWPGVPDAFAVMLRNGTVEITGERRLSVSPLLLGWDLVGVLATDGRRLLAVLGPEDVTPWDVAADRALGPYLRGPTLWPAVICSGPDELVAVSNEHCRLTVWDLSAPPPITLPS